MQQRGVTSTNTSTNTSMESTDSVDLDDASIMQQSRGRHSNNSKLKVLVRSHAMREETSPPRDPLSTTTTAQATSPCIKLTPSSDSYPSSPVLVSRSASPASTLVPSPSPTHHSPQAEFTTAIQQQQQHHHDTAAVNKMNKQNARKKNNNYNNAPEEKQRGAPGGGNNGMLMNKCECLNNNNTFHMNNNNNTLTVTNRVGGCGNGGGAGHHRGKLRQQSSSLGSFDGSSPSLSRDNSSEQYTDTTGVDLEQFIPETLNRNSKDRVLMLRIEEELVQLAKDKGKTHFKFPPMSSYQRMLVHRCAAYFGMDHNIESSGKCVVVNKTKSTRIPDVEFKQHIKDEYTEEPRRSILKRDSNSIEDYNFKSPDRQYSLERRSKSFEEREEEYEKARRRIFNKGNHECSNDDITWADEIAWSNTDSRNHGDHHHHHHHHHRSSRLLKVQSEDPGEETMRPHVAKSYSFGGYGGTLARGDSMMSTHSAGPRLFTKQDSAASSVSWRLSPSSSGYKTQSQRSESITPSPTSTPFYSSNESSSHRQDSTATNASDIIPPISNDDDNQQVVWAVTNIQNVPKGSVIINPQTGKPIKNHDGSLYHHDPEHPLPELPTPTHHDAGANVETMCNEPSSVSAAVSAKPPMSPVKIKSKDRPVSPKKRTSPIKKTNSATSPSLPPLSLLPAVPSCNNPVQQSQLVQSKSFPSYNDQSQSSAALMQTPNQYYGSAYDYTQPCIVYAPYGQMPLGYDTRIETTQLQELPQTYYVDSYQPQAAASNVWPQTQYTIYSNAQPRYATLPVQSLQQQGTFITPYQQPTSYLPPQQPPTQSGTTTTTEIIPVYPQVQQPIIYPQNTNVYPNSNVIYAQASGPPYANAVYPAPPPPPPNAYPLAPTPNTLYQMEQMVQGVAQMHMHAGVKDPDRRMGTPKGGKGRGFSSSHSHSSTENSSPATTVMAYCAAGGAAPMFHRQNSETPPSLPTTPGFGGGSFPPMFIRQMSNVRASPPVQSRTSRSPTPAASTPTMAMMPPAPPPPGVDTQRYPMPPPFVYQAMPYSIPSDTRLVSSRGPPNAYRQQSPRPQYHHHQYNQQQYNANSNTNSNSSHSFGMTPFNHHQAVNNENKFKNRKNRSNKPISQYNNNNNNNNRKQSPN